MNRESDSDSDSEDLIGDDLRSYCPKSMWFINCCGLLAFLFVCLALVVDTYADGTKTWDCILDKWAVEQVSDPTNAARAKMKCKAEGIEVDISGCYTLSEFFTYVELDDDYTESAGEGIQWCLIIGLVSFVIVSLWTCISKIPTKQPHKLKHLGYSWLFTGALYLLGSIIWSERQQCTTKLTEYYDDNFELGDSFWLAIFASIFQLCVGALITLQARGDIKLTHCGPFFLPPNKNNNHKKRKHLYSVPREQNSTNSLGITNINSNDNNDHNININRINNFNKHQKSKSMGNISFYHSPINNPIRNNNNNILNNKIGLQSVNNNSSGSFKNHRNNNINNNKRFTHQRMKSTPVLPGLQPVFSESSNARTLNIRSGSPNPSLNSLSMISGGISGIGGRSTSSLYRGNINNNPNRLTSAQQYLLNSNITPKHFTMSSPSGNNKIPQHVRVPTNSFRSNQLNLLKAIDNPSSEDKQSIQDEELHELVGEFENEQDLGPYSLKKEVSETTSLVPSVVPSAITNTIIYHSSNDENDKNIEKNNKDNNNTNNNNDNDSTSSSLSSDDNNKNNLTIQRNPRKKPSKRIVIVDSLSNKIIHDPSISKRNPQTLSNDSSTSSDSMDDISPKSQERKSLTKKSNKQRTTKPKKIIKKSSKDNNRNSAKSRIKKLNQNSNVNHKATPRRSRIRNKNNGLKNKKIKNKNIGILQAAKPLTANRIDTPKTEHGKTLSMSLDLTNVDLTIDDDNSPIESRNLIKKKRRNRS